MEKNNVEEKVMLQIKTGRVKLRSKYIFLAEKLGLGSALALSVMLAVLFFNLALFYLKASDNIGYLSFGSLGVFAFLESFPYALVAGLIILVFAAALIVKRGGYLYKKPFGRIAIGLVCFILIIGVILTFTDIAERIERRAFGPHPDGMFFRPFLGHGLDERTGGTAGRIIELGENYINIQSPRDITVVDLSHLEFPLQAPLSAGQFVIVVGERRDKIFMAKSLRIVGEGEMPMIRRGVHRRFGEFMPRTPPLPNF
ncbi:MAG: hypothetical protein PHD72_03285 [Patescibacteria group bacterium]|nr:hypothetical protein [Patescibacteria group bacterium]